MMACERARGEGALISLVRTYIPMYVILGPLAVHSIIVGQPLMWWLVVGIC